MMDGPTLQRIRKATGVTQTEFAALVGAQRLAVTRWETGVNPVPGAVEIVACVLEARPEMLDEIRAWRGLPATNTDAAV